MAPIFEPSLRWWRPPLPWWAPSVVWGPHWPHEHPQRNGSLPLGFLQPSSPQQSPKTLGDSPLGQHLDLLHPGVPALGSLWTRQTQKHPPCPTILLLIGITLFCTTLNCGYGATQVLQIWRMYPLQWLPFGRNEPLSTVDIPVFHLPCS